jgi:hypothetical protein
MQTPALATPIYSDAPVSKSLFDFTHTISSLTPIDQAHPVCHQYTQRITSVTTPTISSPDPKKFKNHLNSSENSGKVHAPAVTKNRSARNHDCAPR